MLRLEKSTQHLSKLSMEQKKKFFESFDIIQTDCDGVLWKTEELFAGVESTIRALQTNGKRVIFVSNNSVRSMDEYRSKLAVLNDGPRKDDDIMHPVKAIVAYLRDIEFAGLCYVIGSANFKDSLRSAGFQILDGPNEPVDESPRKVIGIINDEQPVEAVIVDFDYNMNNTKLLRAQMYLKQDALFIAGVMDKELAVGGMRFIGPGCYVELLQNATGRKPIVLGKPGLQLSRMLKKRYSIENPRRVLFVGDQPEMDIKFGSISSYQTLLVGTGGFKAEDLVKLVDKPDEIPDYYIESFAELEQIVRDAMECKQRDEE
uniref:4-nitrophenylphosphatase n=1 Tax=Anopheles epiroticus TaxID=199890 RepID=A0A182PWC7_9DIPT